MTITPEQIRRIKTNDLNDDLVRISLAGWLHQELKRFHAIDVPHQELFGAITKYVECVPDIGMAAEMIDAGVRVRNWPTRQR
jgi:hypothetical protein